MPTFKEYNEPTASSTSSLPLLAGEANKEHYHYKPATKTQRVLQRVLWPIVLHGVIILAYTVIFLFGSKLWLDERDCHKHLIYCKVLKLASALRWLFKTQ